MKNIIIHIFDCQNSEKTTIGNKLKYKYNEKIYTKDLNNLRNEFYQQKEIINYHDFIKLFIEKHNDKPLILTEKCLESINDKNFYVINTKYKYFINNANIKKNNIECIKIHKKHNYKFLDSDKIIQKISKIIDNKQKYMKKYKIIKELGKGI